MNILLTTNEGIYSAYPFKYSEVKDIITKFQCKIPERLNLPSENFPSNKLNLFKAVNEYLNFSHRKLNNLFKIFNSQNSEDIQ